MVTVVSASRLTSFFPASVPWHC